MNQFFSSKIRHFVSPHKGSQSMIQLKQSATATTTTTATTNTTNIAASSTKAASKETTKTSTSKTITQGPTKIPNLNTLDDLISKQAWNDVQQHLQSSSSSKRDMKRKLRTFTHCKCLSDTVRQGFALPLHHALALGAPVHIISALLQWYPNSIRIKERAYRRIPLTIACQNCASKDVIMLLLEKYPQAVMERDDMKRIPLHYAVANHVPADVISKLVGCNSDTAKVEDHRQWLPLHVACVVNASADVIQVLLQANVDAVVKTTPNDGSPWTLYLHGSLHDNPQSLLLIEQARDIVRRKQQQEIATTTTATKNTTTTSRKAKNQTTFPSASDSPCRTVI